MPFGIKVHAPEAWRACYATAAVSRTSAIFLGLIGCSHPLFEASQTPITGSDSQNFSLHQII